MKRIRLFSHTDLDGFGSNLILKYISIMNKEIEFFATNVNYDNVDKTIKKYIKNNEYHNYDYTIITDISVNEEVAILLDNTIKDKLILLDHHKTALWLNEKYSWATVLEELDEEKTSGTELFFKHIQKINLFNDKKLEELVYNKLCGLVTNIKKYDTWLWKNKYDDIKPKLLNDVFKILGYKDFETTVFENDFDIDKIIEANDLILRVTQRQINDYVDLKNKSIFPIQLNSYNVGVVFAEQYISELGSKLSELNPQYDIIAIISPTSVSYRTIKDVDCSEIAKMFGGGGHPGAAGSPITKDKKIKYIKNIFNL